MIVFGQFSHQNLKFKCIFRNDNNALYSSFLCNSNESGPIFKITTNDLICKSITFCCFLVLCENFNHTNKYSIIEWIFRVKFILPLFPKKFTSIEFEILVSIDVDKSNIIQQSIHLSIKKIEQTTKIIFELSKVQLTRQ